MGAEQTKSKQQLVLARVQRFPARFDLDFVNGVISAVHTVIDRNLAVSIAREIENNRVSVIQFTNCSIKDYELKILCQAIRENHSLTEIHLCGSGINDAKAVLISEALKSSNQSLKVLDLFRNSIGVPGAKGLADALKDNKSLNKLNLRANYLGSSGVAEIAKALKINKTLESLNLQSNHIGYNGFQALGEALMINQTLSEILLSQNYCKSQESFQAIANALLESKTLKRIDLSNRKLDDDCAFLISNILKSNNYLEKINLSNNMLGKEGIERILEEACENDRNRVEL
jgi:Ran GTPase-activating protein (RanGAP) involved in mRNA processing and transport